MKNKSTHGGRRKNSGRKPVADKKQAVTVYVPQSTIIKLGGAQSVKNLTKMYIEKQAI